jgi:hypothetical protein
MEINQSINQQPKTQKKRTNQLNNYLIDRPNNYTDNLAGQ